MMVLGYAGCGEHRWNSQVTSKISEIANAWVFDYGLYEWLKTKISYKR